MTASDPAIVLDHVTKEYAGGFRAVDDVSLVVDRGQILVLVGTSGSGKTTTMKMINRLVEPTAGAIRVAGRDVREVDPIELRRSIGYVIQEIGLFPHMTVAKNVALVPSLKGWPKARQAARVRELLELVGLPPDVHADKQPHQLSGGQRQRVGVARALAGDPDLLLMDEPFGALDPMTRGQLQEEFLSLQRRLGKTVVFVTHDMLEAVRLADHIGVMDSGGMLQLGPPAEILGRPVSSKVADLVGADATLKLLALCHVEQAMEPGDLAAGLTTPAVRSGDTLKDALISMVLHGRPAVRVMDGGGGPKGHVTLGGLQRALAALIETRRP